MQRRHFLHSALTTLALCSITGVISACGEKKQMPIPAGATVLALGDSLTEGYGAPLQDSYPTVLEHLTGWRVINAGVTGNTSAQALERLPALLAEYHPQLVITCIGGNDMLRKMSPEQMRSNIIDICRQVTKSSAKNMLIAMPKLSIMGAAIGHLSDDPVYAQIAKELNIPLQSGAWSTVLSNKSLRSDAVHANAQGYQRFAELLATSLREVGYLL